MKKECPICAELIDEHAQVCPYCNEETGFEPAPPQKECPICGEMIDATLSVCPICGEDISLGTTPEPAPDPELVVEPEPEPVVEPQPEPAVEPEPEPIVEPEPAVEPQPEPIAESTSEPVIEQEPVVGPNPITAPEPTLEPEPIPAVKAESAPVVENVVEKQPSSHRNNTLLYIIIALLVVIIGVLVVFLLTRGGDQTPTTDATPAETTPQRMLTIPEKLDSIAAELPEGTYYDVFPDEERQCIYYISDNQLFCETVGDDGYVMPIPLKYEGYEVEVLSARLQDDGNTIEMEVEATNGSKATCLLNTLTGITQMIPLKSPPTIPSTTPTPETQKPGTSNQETKPQQSTPKPTKQQEPEEDVAPANSNGTGWHFEKVDNMPNN